MERDLLLNYIRELYDIALDNLPIVTTKPDNKHFLKTEKSMPSNVQHFEEQKLEIPKAETPVKQAEPTLVPQKENIFTETVKSSLPKEQPKQAIIKEGHEASTKDEGSLAELFIEEKVTELSDKLAFSPIKDLTKSMGINERIFTQQELFENNQAFFNETLAELNKCQSFEEAKHYLIRHVIYKYDWVADNKNKKAATFIKLVKRKFV
ncbi:MAG: hypothetical protein IPO92_01370 [Saprospiraceae bacterium]|nr:hypothetical protein [Saprospiraceae bacterium]